MAAKIPGAQEIVFGTCSVNGWAGFAVHEKHVVAFTPPAILILEDRHCDADEMSAASGVQPEVIFLAVKVRFPVNLGVTIVLPVGGPPMVGLSLAVLRMKVESSQWESAGLRWKR